MVGTSVEAELSAHGDPSRSAAAGCDDLRIFLNKNDNN